MYEYQATVERIVDGDTVELLVDLGFKIRVSWVIRLAGINAPEKNTPEGKDALTYLASLIPPGTGITLHSIKDHQEKYGRYLGVLVDARGQDINYLMVATRHAVEYDGGKR